MANPRVAVVGATGAVGREMLALLEQRRFPHGQISLLASSRSAGGTLRYRGEDVPVHELNDDSLDEVDVALLSAGSGPSKRIAPRAAERGCLVVDNSSAFRMEPGVPLVVPEVNPEAPAPWKQAKRRGGIIANPNCSAIIMLVAVTPLRAAFGIERIVVATYQAASGAGAKAMAELEHQTRATLEGKHAEPKVFHEPYAFNLFSHNTPIDPRTGLNVEEQKIVAETRKIWSEPESGKGTDRKGLRGAGAVRISPTCIRVPVMRAHAEAINVTLSSPATLKQVREALRTAPGVKLVDDREKNLFPTPMKASGVDDVLVGRLRVDLSQLPADVDESAADLDSVLTQGFDMFVAGDQLRKGAALNAVQIAEMIVKR